MGVTSNRIHAPHDIGEVILKVTYNLHEQKRCDKSYNKAKRPTDKAIGGIIVAHLTAP